MSHFSSLSLGKKDKPGGKRIESSFISAKVELTVEGMPVRYYRRRPPEDCPICGQKLDPPYLPDDIRTSTAYYDQLWYPYDKHVHLNHPDFERWDRKMSFYYAIPIILLLGPGWLLLFHLPILAQLTIASLWLLAPIIVVPVWLMKRRGTDRFRKSWNEQRPPENPLSL